MKYMEKISGLLLAAFSVLATGAFAQGIEYDDMYFNAEDRVKLKSQREVAYNTYSSRDKQRQLLDEEYSINPTDSYSARNVNPEYISRAQTQNAQAEESDYFVSDYQYRQNQLNNWNNNYHNWYTNNWYRMNYWGPAINTWHSPYYGYNSWNSPWYDPYWGYNGWSTSFSFHYGNSWNYGWGGYYNPWNRPYYAWDPFYRGIGWYGSGFHNPYRYGYYPGIIVINNPEHSGRRVVEGRRPTRSAAINRTSTRPRSNSDVFDRGNSSGRYSTAPARQAEYYNRSRSSSNSTFYDRQTTQQNRSRSWNSGSSSDRFNNSGRTYSAPSSPSRSYSAPSTSSPSRSMGSGSSGRSRH